MEIRLDSVLGARDAEVIAADIRASRKEGGDEFRFIIEPGFLPTIGWMDRLRGVIEPLVRSTCPVVLSSTEEQRKSLRRAGFDLIADLVLRAER